MDRNNIVTLPHDRLRQKSEKISRFDDELERLVQNMIKASLDWEAYREHEFCVGLAAVQVDVLKKVVVLRDNLENKQDRAFTAVINPKIIKTYGIPEEDYEGCLSVSDIYGRVLRYPKVKVKAQTLEGDEVRITLEGFSARLMQHEIDHTNGIVFIDHIKDNPKAFFRLEPDGKIRPLDYKTEVINVDHLW